MTLELVTADSLEPQESLLMLEIELLAFFPSMELLLSALLPA